MKRITLISLIIAFAVHCYAQFHDNTTLLGFYGGIATPPGQSDIYGISVLTFPDGSLKVEENTELSMYFDMCNSSISDSTGILQLYTNGVYIGNTAWDTLENGWDIKSDQPLRSGWPQFAITLPKPGNGSNIMVYYGDYEIYYFNNNSYLWYCSQNLYAAEVDMTQNNGLGKVFSKDVMVIDDTLSLGKFTACKHANGRDWWILAHEQNNNRFHRVLLDPNGNHYDGAQTIDIPFEDGVGQACFSPDGSKYIMYDAIDFDTTTPIGQLVNIFDFDRCTGLLSNQKQIIISQGAFGGMAISPNSRYMYVSMSYWTYQYDLWADDIEASKILVMEYDGYHLPRQSLSFYLQRMPDDKLYACTVKQNNVLHTIHYPDEPGMACQYEQRAVKLPARNSNSVPNFPYFRLGPLDGSSCDTLGLDNHPRAWYRYEQDTLTPLLVEFRDLSYYEPATWSWNFGDSSPLYTGRHPWHTFPAPGVYEVCLTVSNVNGTDTHCKTLYLGVSAQDNPVLQSQITVSPNPFTDWLSVALNASVRSPVFRLFDATGRLVSTEPLALGIHELETNGLPSGMYFWRVESAGEVLQQGKCLKI